MKKSKKYPYTFFTVEVLQKAISVLEKISNVENLQPSSISITIGNET